MIKNEKQLRTSRKKRQALLEAFDHSKVDDQESYRELIDAVSLEIDEYEGIRAGIYRTFDLHCLDDVGSAAIKARIARQWTQRDLSRETGVTEQQVQKDEAKNYETAGLARLAEILDVLDYEVVGCVRPRQNRFVPATYEYVPQSISNNVDFQRLDPTGSSIAAAVPPLREIASDTGGRA